MERDSQSCSNARVRCCGYSARSFAAVSAASLWRPVADSAAARNSCTSVTRITFQRFVKERDRSFGALQQQLRKPAEKEPDTVPSLRPVEVHRPFNGRNSLAGAPEKGCIVSGE